MASGLTTAFWGMTINNYDETDLALVQNGYPDYMREIIHTLEEGEEGTPHIQAWIKLQRQQRLSFVKKLFPRGHFKPLTSDDYIANTKKYAQKLDDTAAAAAVHKFNDPIPDTVRELKRVFSEAYRYYGSPKRFYDMSDEEISGIVRLEQHNRVRENPQLAKLYVSAQYKAIVKEYLRDICRSVWEEEQKLAHTHTHTHSEEKFSRDGGITDDDATQGNDESGEEDTEGSSQGEEDSEDYTEGEGSCDETDSEGGDYGTGEDTSGEED